MTSPADDLPESPRWRPNNEDKNKRTSAVLKRELVNHAFSVVRRADLQRVIDRQSPGMAFGVGSSTKTMFSWAKKRDMIRVNRAEDLTVPRSQPRSRVLSPTEIGEFWRLCPNEAAGLKFILLTGARPGEVYGMEEREITEESDGLWWTLPAARSKNGEIIRRPLSALAKEVLRLGPSKGVRTT